MVPPEKTPGLLFSGYCSNLAVQLPALLWGLIHDWRTCDRSRRAVSFRDLRSGEENVGEEMITSTSPRFTHYLDEGKLL